LVWFGLVWFGLVWFGLVWFGLVWFGLVWFGLVWFFFGFFLVFFVLVACSHFFSLSYLLCSLELAVRFSFKSSDLCIKFGRFSQKGRYLNKIAQIGQLENCCDSYFFTFRAPLKNAIEHF